MSPSPVLDTRPRGGASRSHLFVALLIVALTLVSAAALHRGEPPAGNDRLSLANATSSDRVTTCRGQHLDGFVVVEHTRVADCPNSSYYSYNADVWQVPGGSMMYTCNGDNEHGDPPAPYVITTLTKYGNCDSYMGTVEYVTSYLIKPAAEGLAVCKTQKRLPAGWAWDATRPAFFSYDCRNPRTGGFGTTPNAGYVKRA
ncbi:hypothetical protein [Micromonospora maritima]|uniref:Uncharacterized protein n=1 Tax=Micromonospora maritima TaxID=986711 RepID=A0ABW7ZJX5_9ACTN